MIKALLEDLSILVCLIIIASCNSKDNNTYDNDDIDDDSSIFSTGRCDTGRVEKVLEVVDGDTIYLDNYLEEENSYEKVRYIGIDTPEYATGICYELATEYNSSLVSGRAVTLEIDRDCIDDYGRTLAYIWIGDRMVNMELVCDGYAEILTIPPNTKYHKEFEECQKKAMEEGIGLWRYGCF